MKIEGTSKAMVREKFIALNVHIRKEKRSESMTQD